MKQLCVSTTAAVTVADLVVSTHVLVVVARADLAITLCLCSRSIPDTFHLHRAHQRLLPGAQRSQVHGAQREGLYVHAHSQGAGEGTWPDTVPLCVKAYPKRC